MSQKAQFRSFLRPLPAADPLSPAGPAEFPPVPKANFRSHLRPVVQSLPPPPPPPPAPLASGSALPASSVAPPDPPSGPKNPAPLDLPADLDLSALPAPQESDLPEGFRLTDLDLGVDVSRISVGSPKSRQRLILWLWWDSKKRRWVVVFAWAIRQLTPWMDQVVVRDLGWTLGSFEHHVAVAACSGNTAHDQIAVLADIPQQNTFPHVLKVLLPQADAIIAIGTRGFGLNILSLASVLASAKAETPVLATRFAGRLPSYKTTAGDLSNACLAVSRRFGYTAPASSPTKTGSASPLPLAQIAAMFATHGGPKGLAQDQTDCAEVMALDLLAGFVGRLELSQGKLTTNLGGNAHRFPTRLFPSTSRAAPVAHATPAESFSPEEAEVLKAAVAARSTAGPAAALPSTSRASTSDLAQMMLCALPLAVPVRCSEIGCDQEATHKQTKLCDEHHNTLDATSSSSLATKRKPGGFYDCPTCEESFGSVTLFDDHIVNDHAIFDYYQCTEPFCRQRLTRRQNLVQHIQTVHGGGKYPCAELNCSWRSNHKRQVEMHARFHKRTSEEDQEQTCQVCQITTTNKGNLQNHEATAAHKKLVAQTGEAPSDTDQTYHKRVRKGPKPKKTPAPPSFAPRTQSSRAGDKGTESTSGANEVPPSNASGKSPTPDALQGPSVEPVWTARTLNTSTSLTATAAVKRRRLPRILDDEDDA